MEKPSARALKNHLKKSFLISSADSQKRSELSSWIKNKFPDAVIYTASEQRESFQKIINAPPTVLITDFILSRANTVQTIENLIEAEEYHLLPIIVIGEGSKKSDYVDAVVTGKVQFIDRLENENDLSPYLNRALNFANSTNPSDYKLKYLNVNDILIREGEEAKQVYILKKGKLRAYKFYQNTELALGFVNPGEFVGEMAFLNKSERIATVQAVEESEVVEIPIAIFDQVIFKKPAWSKVLLETMSKRLSNAFKSKN